MLGTVGRYENYKDSGIPWIGDVPVDWQVLPGRACLYENKSKNVGMIESQVLSLSYGRVIVKTEDKLTGLVPESFETYQIVEPGDIIVRGTDLQNDVTSLRIGLAKDCGIITSAYINLRPRSNVSPFFLHYMLHSYDTQKVFYGLGSGLRQNLSYDDFKHIGITLPDLDTQNRIVEFLDEKTAEIDAAIEKKRRLIDLLNEQKVISFDRALAGLRNPDQLTETGNNFFPKIGSGFNLIALRRLVTKVADGPHFSPNYVDEGVMFLSAGNIRPDRFLLDDVKYVSGRDAKEFDRRIIPQVGDVVYTKGGTTGVAKVVDIQDRFQVWVHIAVLKVRKDKVQPEFLAYALNSTGCYLQSQLYTRGATNKDLGLNRMVNIQLPLPDLDTQRGLVEWLDDRQRNFNEAATCIEAEIEALNEFKQTLIANAVTGKIKI